MTLSARFFRWHRWLGWLVAVQVLAWIVGGVVFTWLPFKPWVKGEEAVTPPRQALPSHWAAQVARHMAGNSALPPVIAVQSVATAGGPALRLRHADGDTWLSAHGGELPAPDATAIAGYARSLYRGQGTLAQVDQLAEVPARLLIVREAGASRNVWRASFDDALGTRLYFEGRSGQLLAVRNDAWALYDFLWRLHLMDYAHGEDFNHWLIKAASLLALGLVLTGLVLTALALRRNWRTRRRHLDQAARHSA
jgi:hypothetical protein